MLRIGIDVGGTFTDFVIHNPSDGTINTFKLLSDNMNPATTVLQGLETIRHSETAQIIHGSTVATNALLERKGARVALITTSGFKDVLQIGRQNRPNLYDWTVQPPPPLVPSEFRFEVNERIDSIGNVVKPLDIQEINEIIDNLHKNDIESIAVCLLFSFIFPLHEQMIAEQLRNFGFYVTASYEILPEYREYERSSTTVVNSYVTPVLNRYLSNLQNSLPDATLQIMRSNGGMISLIEAKQNGAACILSGPAGGVVGAQHIGQTILENYSESAHAQKLKLITFDMGGTSTDVSLIEGQLQFTTEALVGGYPIHLPLLDIHTIGAGGGSIAYIDRGGSLRVGPQSAGAEPGPACYGKGGLPTVTDANLVLGRLIPEHFLGGKMKISPERSYSALSQLGKSINLSPEQTALGVIDVVNIQMERALRVISIERGHDPHDFSLFSFGGAGGLHAVELARDLAIPKVIISKFASTLSALGMLATNVVKDYVQTVMLPGDISPAQLDMLFAPIVARGREEVKKEGFVEEQILIHCSLDIRYFGQSYELDAPYSPDYLDLFQKIHELTYGYAFPNKPIEIVNLRVKVIGLVPPICLPQIILSQENEVSPFVGYTRVVMKDGRASIPMYIYDHLQPDTIIDGPALIVSSDTTILVDKKDSVSVDKYQNLLIDIHLSNP